MLGLGNPGKIVGCRCLPDGTCQFVQAAAGMGAFNPAETPVRVGLHWPVHYDQRWSDDIESVNPLSQRRLSSMQSILSGGDDAETAKRTEKVLVIGLATTAALGLAYLVLRKKRRS